MLRFTVCFGAWIFALTATLSAQQAEHISLQTYVLRFAGDEPNAEFLREVENLRKQNPQLDKQFNGVGRAEAENYLIWNAARACKFQLATLKRSFPKLCAMGSTRLDVLDAKTWPKGSGSLLLHKRSVNGDYQLDLLYGAESTPLVSAYSPNSVKWNDPEVTDDLLTRFGPFRLESKDGRQYAVGYWYYHPFPKDKTWPKWKLWIRLDADRLTPDRIEKYVLPASEDAIKPEYLKKTMRPLP